jgi:hypothetical protein
MWKTIPHFFASEESRQFAEEISEAYRQGAEDFTLHQADRRKTLEEKIFFVDRRRK